MVTRRPVTLKDVAEVAGVSVSTVSRVLDDRLPRSRSASAARVRTAAEQLGYRADIHASALRRGEGTGTIGVLVPRLSDTVMALMFEAIFAEAARRRHFALVSVCGDDPDSETRAVEGLLGRRVDGLVLASARLDDPLPQSLRERRIPHVMVLRSDRVSPSSVGDDELGGYLATRHLLDLGHRRIGILAGPELVSTGQDRLAGYRRAMAEAGVEVPPSWVAQTDFSSAGGDLAAAGVLAADPTVSALFAVNDSMALGALSALTARGLSVPDDVSIVGYNDTFVAQRLPIPFTSVRVPFDQVAAGALDLLDDVRADRTLPAGTRRVCLPTLIPRASTATHRPPPPM